MNNSNGADMLARLLVNQRVTIRAIDGSQLTGVYVGRDERGRHVMATGRHTGAEVTASNIVRVQS